jgi:subfamily B ATP-binding cassette protein MsbA
LSREDRASLEKATNISESANFIKNFSKQYNEQIGESGSRLSGGQKQRISLARSLFFNKDILILDESSSSLDEDLEISVNNSIQKNNERTIFCISHSNKVVKYFNVHFHLEEGKLTRIK